MDDSYKKRVWESINKFSSRGLKQKRKYQNKEGPVALAIYNHLKSLGWSVDIIEVKGSYNAEAGRYLSGKTRAGYADISGNTPNGIACYIEVKAKDRRNTLKDHQRDFLIEKISTNSFAIVADSIPYLMECIKGWESSMSKKAYLLSLLPIKRGVLPIDRPLGLD